MGNMVREVSLWAFIDFIDMGGRMRLEQEAAVGRPPARFTGWGSQRLVVFITVIPHWTLLCYGHTGTQRAALESLLT